MTEQEPEPAPEPPKPVPTKVATVDKSLTPNVDWAVVNQYEAAQLATQSYGPAASWGSSTEISSQAGLADLAVKLNPTLGYWGTLWIPTSCSACPLHTVLVAHRCRMHPF